MAFTLQVQLLPSWTDQVSKAPDLSGSFTSCTIVKDVPLQGIDTTYDTIYDASQTTVPGLGNSDTGDQPFCIVGNIGGDTAILKITDDQGDANYMTLPSGMPFCIPSDIMGSTESAIIAQLDIKASSTSLTGHLYIVHD